MNIRMTQARDWALLKQARLAALLDAPTAFAVKYDTALGYEDKTWEERATSSPGLTFWLAFENTELVGMIGAGVNQNQRFNLIGMWVNPAARGSGVAKELVNTVKTHAAQNGYDTIYLDVSPNNNRAVQFYYNQGFAFVDEWEPLASHPEILLQTMIFSTTEPESRAVT
jgi:ribosomal protein S18 acetylase RimI-like enzyme